MKTNLNKILGWGSVLALVAGFTSTALAGPGPQFWQQQDKVRAENAAKAKAAAPVDAPAVACASCKTSDVTEFRSSQAGGKVPGRYDKIGTKHECAMCGGATTTVRGKTTSDMKANCPVCAEVTRTCCKTS